MRVRIGYHTQTYGYVEDGPQGMVLTGTTPDNQQRLATLIVSLRPYYAKLSDGAFVQILPRALSGGSTWAHDTIYDTATPAP